MKKSVYAMKPRAALAAVVAAALPLLMACQSTPTTPTAQDLAAKTQALASPVPVLALDAKGQAIIAYFGAADTPQEGQLMQAPQERGFYRVYLGKNNAGQHLIQDMYQSNGAAQTDAFAVEASANLQEWEVIAQEGEIVYYRPSGEVRGRTGYRGGQLHGRDVYYNNDGSERSLFSWRDGLLEGPFFAREPGTQRSVSGMAQNDEIVDIGGTDAQGAPLTPEQALDLLETSLHEWHKDIFE